jgi:hypothetical protein
MGGDAIVSTAGAYTSLEALDVTRPEVDAVIQLYLRRNVYYDATVSAYGYWYNPKDPRVFAPWADEQSFLTPHVKQVVDARSKPQMEQFHRIYDAKLKEVKRFYDAGGGRLITVGTDHPSWGEYWSGFGTHRELNALVVAGLPPSAAIKCATVNAARALGMGDKLGTIEAGKLADLVVTRGNPLSDITNTHNVLRVMVRGQLYDAAALLAQAKGTLGPKSAADDD